MRIPRKVALLGAAVLILALLPASSAFAYNAKEKAAEKKQNARTKKLSKDLTALKKLVDTVNQGLPGLKTTIDGVDTRLKVIEGAAPQIISGLQSLKTLGTSTEYGIGQVFIGGNPEPGAFVVTPDIPDAVQQAQVTNQFIASQAGAITLRVGVRSAENDGTGTDNPAAHCRVTITQEGAPASPAARTSSPNPELGGAPFWPIDTKSKQTSTDEANKGFPFGPKTSGEDADILSDLTTGANSTAPAGSPTASAGQPYSVSLSCVDISASADNPSS